MESMQNKNEKNDSSTPLYRFTLKIPLLTHLSWEFLTHLILQFKRDTEKEGEGNS